MNKRQVIILWGIAIVLGVSVATMKTLQNRAVQSATHRAHGQTLFESFPAKDAATIQIQGAGESVTLASKDGKWSVAERDNYPANVTRVNDLIRTLDELKVTMGMEAGPSFAPRFGMDENATTAEDRGLTATFKDAAAQEIAKVSFGKSITSASDSSSPMGGGNAVGRYVRNHADESGFYAVSEMFPSLSADAKYWLAEGFLNIEKIKSITVSESGQSEPLWKLTRESEEAEFTLTGATGGEVLDTAITAPLKSLFSYARFEDVVPAAELAARRADDADDAERVVVIETVEGFTYTVHLSPAATASPNEQEAAAEKYLLTAEVTANLPGERKKEAGEKPEDASAKDAAFTARHKALSDKLAQEQTLAGITFVVGESLVEPLLKDRKGLTTDATPKPQPAGAAGAVQQLPGGMIAPPPPPATTTQPIGIPADGVVVEEIEE